jgi:hypothetical protein
MNIATRQGRPAYENAPPRKMAAVPMREWLSRRPASSSPAEGLNQPNTAFEARGGKGQS